MADLGFIFALVLAAIVITLSFLYIFVRIAATFPDVIPGIRRSELSYLDPARNVSIDFPSLDSPATIDMTVVVPAYNEESRISEMLQEAIDHLESKKKTKEGFKYEIIVVDDGSADKTSLVATKFSHKHGVDIIRVLKLKTNCGKGGAVQRGFLCARGQRILFADADGATRFSDIDTLTKKLDEIEENGLGVVVGSRAHLVPTVVAKRKWHRNFLMYGWHVLVYLLGVRGIHDTQCGFKLFTRKTAERIIPTQHLQRWCFDIELLMLARWIRSPIGEVPVHWHEVEGSKLRLVGVVMMAKDLLLVRFAYLFGVWRFTRFVQ